ncbi:hypothetical protein CALVIDRAFT_563289 [Calocera viscosa TUFC12733]|uniref:Uncharacterized protein n=1 Tax=Calocera viscosa (strain TUFC12733) TaxID=1330018 RepID=A0A167MUJ4_CALVF|nr:hypothetical protein CALVIDRAFT_563289 [Calocera viscosa TUFC12733]
MHTCPCRISQGDVAYCSASHARADAALALAGNQHTFYRAYWRRFAPDAARSRMSKPLPAPPRPAREEEECVRYPVPLLAPGPALAPQTRPALQRFQGYVQKQLPDPPSTWSVTTCATRPAVSATTAATAGLPDSRKFTFPPPLPARSSDLMSVCTTPDLEEGRWSLVSSEASEASGDSEEEEEGESGDGDGDGDERPPGSPTLTRVSDWLEVAGVKLVLLRGAAAGSGISEVAPEQGQEQETRAQEEKEEETIDIPPPLPPKPKLRHRECSVHLPSPSHPYTPGAANTPRVSTATARERVYDDLRKHSIFRAYFEDGGAPERERLEQREGLGSEALQARTAPGRKGHSRRVSERWVQEESVPPVPPIPEKYKVQLARPPPVERYREREEQLKAGTRSIHPLRIRKLLDAAPPTAHDPSPSPSAGPPTPPKSTPGPTAKAATGKECKADAEDSAELDPQEYRDSLAAESGWWEPTAPALVLPPRDGEREMSLRFLAEDPYPYPAGVWAS